MIKRKEAIPTITGKIAVQESTLDQFIKDENFLPDWVRMDVEGYEVEIIKGMKEYFKNKRKNFEQVVG